MNTQIGQTLSASDFQKTYPIGQTLSSDDFNKKYNTPTAGTPKPKTQFQKDFHSSPMTQYGKNLLTGALPAIGSTVGAIGGGLIAGAAATPETLGAGTIPAAYAGAVAGSAIGGTIGESGKEFIQGQKASPGNILKSGAEYGALEAVAGPALSLAGKGVEALGEGIGKMFIPKSEIESALLQTYKATTSFIERVKSILNLGGKEAPSTSASSAFKTGGPVKGFGLMGTERMLGVQAEKAQTKLWNNLVGPALKQSDVKLIMSDFLKEAETKIIKETTDLTRQKVLLNALNSIKEDYKGIGKFSLEQLQKYKEGWDEFVPEKAYKGQPIAGALNDVRNTLAGMSRDKIYKALGDNVKQAYFDYSNLFGIKKLGIKAGTGVTSIIKGGTGTSIKAILEMVTIPVGTIGGQTIYKVGQGIELLGTQGARTVRNLLFGAGTSSKSVLPASQFQDTLPSESNQSNSLIPKPQQ